MLSIRKNNRNYDLISSSICNSITDYMRETLDKNLNKAGYKGLIFECNEGLYIRYYDADFKKILNSIGYRPISQSIPKSEKKNIHKYLAKRLKERLGVQIEQNMTKRGKVSVSAGGIITGEAEGTNNTKEVYERAETFIGLIESHLQKSNLMIIIINADDIILNNIEQTTADIFAAGTDFDERAALTLVHSSSFVSSYNSQLKIWRVFTPDIIIREKDFVNLVWTKLPRDQQLFKNYDELAKIVIESRGSANIVREKWDEYVTNLLKRS